MQRFAETWCNISSECVIFYIELEVMWWSLYFHMILFRRSSTMKAYNIFA
jgi:hypothetical protein